MLVFDLTRFFRIFDFYQFEILLDILERNSAFVMALDSSYNQAFTWLTVFGSSLFPTRLPPLPKLPWHCVPRPHTTKHIRALTTLASGAHGANWGSKPPFLTPMGCQLPPILTPIYCQLPPILTSI